MVVLGSFWVVFRSFLDRFWVLLGSFWGCFGPENTWNDRERRGKSVKKHGQSVKKRKKSQFGSCFGRFSVVLSRLWDVLVCEKALIENKQRVRSVTSFGVVSRSLGFSYFFLVCLKPVFSLFRAYLAFWGCFRVVLVSF